MAKAWSTKIPDGVPEEFEQVFVQYGHRVAEQTFGKRCTTRSRFAIGVARLNRLRRAFVRGEA